MREGFKCFCASHFVTICTQFQQIGEDVKNLYTGQGLFVVPVRFVGYTVAIENSTRDAEEY